MVGGFAGATHGGEGGSNGIVIVDGRQIWVGNGNGSVEIIDLAYRRAVASVSTVGVKRVDELGYDPRDHLFTLNVLVLLEGRSSPLPATPDHSILVCILAS